MTIPFLLLLGFSGLMLYRLGWRKTGMSACLANLVLLVAIGCGLLPAYLLAGLQSTYAQARLPEWGNRNAIVLLGAGAERLLRSNQATPALFAYSRIVKATELYRSCRGVSLVCKLIVSGGDAREVGISEALLYKGDLIQLGVPEADLILESQSLNTWQNAERTLPILLPLHPDKVALVSSAMHLRRASLYFAHFGMQTTPIDADYLTAAKSWVPTAYNFTVCDLALHEYLGIARYYVYGWLGWNKSANAAGSA